MQYFRLAFSAKLNHMLSFVLYFSNTSTMIGQSDVISYFMLHMDSGFYHWFVDALLHFVKKKKLVDRLNMIIWRKMKEKLT